MDELRIEPDDYEPKEAPKDEAPFDIPAANDVKPAKKLKRAPEPAPADPENTYNYPPIDMLEQGMPKEAAQDDEADLKKARLLEETLRSFGIQTKLTGIAHGPAVTRFELQPAPGVKVSRITSRRTTCPSTLPPSACASSPIPERPPWGWRCQRQGGDRAASQCASECATPCATHGPGWR